MADQILFKFKEYVQLWQTDRNVPNINAPMIQYNTKIYKGGTNTIDFVVRNNDRKPVNLVGYQITALIQRVENSEMILEKDVYATDEVAGKARLTLYSGEIEPWFAGFYRYTIRVTDVTGKQEFLYTDVNRSTFGDFELIEGMSVALVPALQIPRKKFTPYPLGDYDNTWSTGALAGDSQLNRLSGMHTIVAYTKNNFIGKLWIQGSLTTQPPLETDWFNVRLFPDSEYYFYNEKHSPTIQAFNFTGNYYWVRAFFQEDPTNKGEFVKIQYKN